MNTFGLSMQLEETFAEKYLDIDVYIYRPDELSRSVIVDVSCQGKKIYNHKAPFPLDENDIKFHPDWLARLAKKTQIDEDAEIVSRKKRSCPI